MNALHLTTPVSPRYHPLGNNTIFDITYYYPMGFRHYHHQPYRLPPSWASGITTISLTNYSPLGHQVLPPLTRSNYCLAQPFISVQFIVCSIVGLVTFIYLLIHFWRISYDRVICGWALSLELEFLVFHLQRVWTGTGKV